MDGGPIYYWLYQCAAGCTFEKTSPEPLGVPSWGSEACPVVGCGRPIHELVIAGPPEYPPQ